MIIDEEKLYTHWSNLKKAKRYTDHNAIIFRLNVPTPNKKGRKPTNILRGILMICMDGINLARLLKMTNNCWNDSASFEECCQQWNNRLNYFMYTYKKKLAVPQKKL